MASDVKLLGDYGDPAPSLVSRFPWGLSVNLGRAPEIVAHVRGLIPAARDAEVPHNVRISTPYDPPTRGAMLAEALGLSAGPNRGEGGCSEYWSRALWLCRDALIGIDCDDPVVTALRRMSP